MRQVETHERPRPHARPGDGLQVEGLSGVEVHPAEQHEASSSPSSGDARLDVLGAQGVSLLWGRISTRSFWIAAVEASSGGHGVGVAREGPFLAEDLLLRPSGR